MAYIPITLQEFDSLCKIEKGWVRNRSGYEYVYDYVMPNIHLNRNGKDFYIMVKILSSVSIESAKGRNKGSDAIRVYAVMVDDKNKVVRGVLKAITVYRVKGWKDNTIQAYKDTRDKVLKLIKDRKL